ncbi:hypothetical protein Fot_25819 [Forsythia ovata]|uniref:Uncharacterized protein n=1 Tax=Forsythia ovata TaxID=205694 RepID=A0ABD1UA39_9LAMI
MTGEAKRKPSPKMGEAGIEPSPMTGEAEKIAESYDGRDWRRWRRKKHEAAFPQGSECSLMLMVSLGILVDFYCGEARGIAEYRGGRGYSERIRAESYVGRGNLDSRDPRWARLGREPSPMTGGAEKKTESQDGRG